MKAEPGERKLPGKNAEPGQRKLSGKNAEPGERPLPVGCDRRKGDSSDFAR